MKTCVLGLLGIKEDKMRKNVQVAAKTLKRSYFRHLKSLIYKYILCSG